jgi:uncharacterized alkaline shock family protein YloU
MGIRGHEPLRIMNAFNGSTLSRRLASNPNSQPSDGEVRLGRIEVSPQAVAAIAGREVLSCYGVVGLASRRLHDGFGVLLHRGHFTRGVDVHLSEGRIIIDLYVIVEYGTRISEVARGIMSTVKFAVERALGVAVAEVNVNVQGLRISEED